jgi:hypothetical protein
VTYSIRILAVLVLLAVAPQANRTQVPQFEPDPLWSQSLPNKWVTGQVGGLAVLGEVNNGQRYYRYAYKGMGTAAIPASR